MRSATTVLDRRATSSTVAAGEYFCTARDLYRVERVLGDRALIEDCRSGILIDTAVGELCRLRRVRRDADHAA